jgi:MarR family transcriptional regulator, organic hydroperoxide resistance regulator
MAKASLQRARSRRPAARPSPRRAAEAKGPVGTTYRIGDYPMHYLAAIQRQNQLNLGHALRAVGISVPMWRALAALHDKDGQTIGQIAEMTVLDRSSLGRLLEEMAAQGLVERESPPDDRRAVLIRLSAAGRRRFEAAEPIVLGHYRRLLHGISEREFRTLMRLLRRLKANTRMMSDVATLEIE